MISEMIITIANNNIKYDSSEQFGKIIIQFDNATLSCHSFRYINITPSIIRTVSITETGKSQRRCEMFSLSSYTVKPL